MPRCALLPGVDPTTSDVADPTPIHIPTHNQGSVRRHASYSWISYWALSAQRIPGRSQTIPARRSAVARARRRSERRQCSSGQCPHATGCGRCQCSCCSIPPYPSRAKVGVSFSPRTEWPSEPSGSADTLRNSSSPDLASVQPRVAKDATRRTTAHSGRARQSPPRKSGLAQRRRFNASAFSSPTCRAT